MKTITIDTLKERIAKQRPSNDDKTKGYALVNVLDHKAFLDEHIPGSINIPKGQEAEFERRFDKSKEIVVYCGSFDCTASGTVADVLTKKGFKNVLRYEGGMNDWKQAHNKLERGESPVREMQAM